MLLVDSSVWIDYFNGVETPQTRLLRDEVDRAEVAVGDLILCEVLQGFSRERDLRGARRLLLGFRYFDMVGQSVALQAAANYRLLRRNGITIRKTIDVLIATFCVLNDFRLLHADRDFDPMQRYLDLRVASTD